MVGVGVSGRGCLSGLYWVWWSVGWVVGTGLWSVGGFYWWVGGVAGVGVSGGAVGGRKG